MIPHGIILWISERKKSNYCMNYLAEKAEQMTCNVKLWSATVFSNIQLELFDYYFFPVSCILNWNSWHCSVVPLFGQTAIAANDRKDAIKYQHSKCEHSIIDGLFVYTFDCLVIDRPLTARASISPKYTHRQLFEARENKHKMNGRNYCAQNRTH